MFCVCHLLFSLLLCFEIASACCAFVSPRELVFFADHVVLDCFVAHIFVVAFRVGRFLADVFNGNFSIFSGVRLLRRAGATTSL